MGNEYQILPFYFVLDVSYSMEQDGRIDTVNSLLPQLRQALMRRADVADMVKIGVIDFADDARVVLPLSDLREVEQLPLLVARGGTSYAAAFRLLKQQIESDYSVLRGDNYTIKRTGVLFLSDGDPTDDESEWKAAYAELTGEGFARFPNLIPIGIGACNRDNLNFIRHRKEGAAAMPALILQDGVDPSGAIAELIPKLIQSVVNSAAKAAADPDKAGEAAKGMAEVLVDADGFDPVLD